MLYKLGVKIFSAIEIVIGLVTLLAVSLSLAQGSSQKPLPVLIFVLGAAFSSALLGIGILGYNRACYHLLLYFSSVVILSKILIFSGVIILSGALETAIPQQTKNIVSIIYHGLLIFYFTRKPVKDLFGERRKLFFIF